MAKHEYSNWLPEEDYKKILGQARLQLNGIFTPFHRYGMDVFVPGAIEQTMIIIEKVGQRLRGKDVPIVIERKRRRK